MSIYCSITRSTSNLSCPVRKSIGNVTWKQRISPLDVSKPRHHSLIHLGCFAAWSDVDIVAWGLQPHETFRAIGDVSSTLIAWAIFLEGLAHEA